MLLCIQRKRLRSSNYGLAWLRPCSPRNPRADAEACVTACVISHVGFVDPVAAFRHSRHADSNAGLATERTQRHGKRALVRLIRLRQAGHPHGRSNTCVRSSANVVETLIDSVELLVGVALRPG